MATKTAAKARLAIIVTDANGAERAYHTIPVKDDAQAAAERAETVRLAAEAKTGLTATVRPYLCGA